MIESLRTGDWLTRDRLRMYPRLLGLGLGAALALMVATRAGPLDHWGRPLGTDFSQVWVAGLEVLAGHPAQPFDNAAHAAAQAAAFGPTETFYSWPYPPYFLAVAALAALLPYLGALAVWQGGTLLLYAGAVLRAGRAAQLRRAVLLLPALVYPAVTINLMHGHNGFLTAALLATGALLLPSRPGRAGLLLGLLAYKPQFALVIPVALAAGRHGRATVAAVLTVAAATLLTLALFGTAPWIGFADSLGFTRHVVLEQGGPGFGKMQSAFAAIRLLGGPVPLAYAVQGLVTAGVLAALAWLWRSPADPRLRIAGLLTASLLSTPYCMDYDMVVLGPALAALLGHGLDRGFRPYGKTILAALWIMPLIARPLATAFAMPVGVLAMLVLFWHIVATARDARVLARGENTTTIGSIPSVSL